MQAWRAFLGAHAAVMRALEDDLPEDGLPLSWYDVLVQLEAAGVPLRMQELADRLVLSRSGVTRLIDRMEAAGLVERQPCPTDRRGTFAALTDAGGRRLREESPGHLEGIQRHFARHLTEDEARALSSALGRIGSALQREDSSGM